MTTVIHNLKNVIYKIIGRSYVQQIGSVLFVLNWQDRIK